MPIPGPLDGKLNELDDVASSVMVQLRTMRHAAKGDRPKMRAALRERVQSFANLAMALADEIGE